MHKASIWVFTGVAIFFADPGQSEGANGDSIRGGTLFNQQCAFCHSNEGSGGQGPNLRGVVGRKPGATEFGYSGALKAASWVWTEGRLDRFLENPTAAVPGTSMPFAVPEAKDRADLIAYLKTLTSTATIAAPRPRQGAPNTSIFGDWHADSPGLRHRITLGDLPPPYETPSAGNPPLEVPRPPQTKPKAPDGFSVDLFADRLSAPRMIRTAPNGDLFVTETAAGRVRVLIPRENGKSTEQNTVYASGLSEPFGIAFYPQGADP